MFAPKDIDLENGELDESERDVEAFKRFCYNSVVPTRKQKVKLDVKSISLNKK